METKITFDNFDYRAQAKDLKKVIKIFDDVCRRLINKVYKYDMYVYSEEELKEKDLSTDIFYTEFNEICDKGYINKWDIYEIENTLFKIKRNIWEEDYDSLYEPEISAKLKYRELKHLKEQINYIFNNLHL